MKWYCNPKFENCSWEDRKSRSRLSFFKRSSVSDVTLISPSWEPGARPPALLLHTVTSQDHGNEQDGGFWGPSNVLFLHLSAGYKSVFALGKVSELHAQDICIIYFQIYVCYMHISRSMLYLNTFFKIHRLRCVTISTLFFQTHNGFQLNKVAVIYNLL